MFLVCQINLQRFILNKLFFATAYANATVYVKTRKYNTIF